MEDHVKKAIKTSTLLIKTVNNKIQARNVLSGCIYTFHITILFLS